MTKIDITKPLQLADGTPVIYEGPALDSSAYVNIAFNGEVRHYSLSTGKHRYGRKPDLQNVPEVAPKFTAGDRVTAGSNYGGAWTDLVYKGKSGSIHLAVRASDKIEGGFAEGTLSLIDTALDITKPLQTVDGKPVKFIAKTEDGRLVVEVTYGGFSKPTATELRFADGRKSSAKGRTSGDDVIVKLTEKVTFRNIYADGTTGDTRHGTEADAHARSKYRKVRIGALKQTLRDGALVSSSVIPSATPWVRDSSNPKGRAAVQADYLA